MSVGSFQGTERQWADPSVEPQAVEHALMVMFMGTFQGTGFSRFY